MKVLVKNLSGIGFRIEVKPEDTIADVKRTIEIVQGADVYPAARQMLVHQGKVLRDDGSTLEENNVMEESFIVVMLSQPRVPPIVQATESTAQPMHTQSTDTTPATPTVPNEIVLGHCPSMSPGGAGTGGAENNQTWVFSMQSMLQELVKQDPQLSIFKDHEADILQYIRPVREGIVQSRQAAPIPESVQLTPEENEAIGRLEALGFDHAEVLHAFFACNKNEEDAADYLVESAWMMSRTSRKQG